MVNLNGEIFERTYRSFGGERINRIERMGGIDAFISDRQVLTRWDIHDYSGRVNFTAQNQNISHVTCPSLISIKIRRFELKIDSKLKCKSIRFDFAIQKRPPEFTLEWSFLFT